MKLFVGSIAINGKYFKFGQVNWRQKMNDTISFIYSAVGLYGSMNMM